MGTIVLIFSVKCVQNYVTVGKCAKINEIQINGLIQLHSALNE